MEHADSTPPTIGLGFVGCGRIAEAMIRGLVRDGYPVHRIFATSRTNATPQRLAGQLGINVSRSITELAKQAEILVLAVHPHEVEEVLEELSKALDKRRILLSVVASRTTRSLAAALEGTPVIRAVPNLPIAVGCGATALAPARDAEAALDIAVRLFERLGVVIVVDEPLLELVSALAGAGPAVLARIAKALVTAAVNRGLEPKHASMLITQVLQGTASLMGNAGMSPDDVIGAVSSPGGMTEAALRAIEGRELEAALEAGLDAAVRRSIERIV
jgi:pyrroline-5-carboxylate reductase